MKTQASTAFNTLNGKEIISLRSENTKHFDLGRGRRQAVIFSGPVHYQNAKGAWEEIDSRLSEKTDSRGRRMLESRAGSFRARFFENAGGGSLASMKSGGVEFGWSYPGANTAFPAHASKRLRRSFDSGLDRRMKVMDRLTDDVLYESLFPGMSVRLTVDALGVKEDIILENADALSHAVLSLPDGFEYVKNADDSVSVLKNGKPTLRIDAPFTYDANMSPLDTRVSLAPALSGALLSYEIDENDLASAAFPVTIDPRVSFSGTHSAVETVGINDRKKDASDYSYLMTTGRSAGSSGGSVFTYITLCKFNSLMAKKASDTILSAQLYMKVAGGGALYKFVCAYPMLKNWDINDVSWNKVSADTNEFISDRIQSFVSYTNTTYSVFDITDLYNSWYEKDENGNSRNFGVALARPRDYLGYDFMNYYGSSTSKAANRPYVVVDYVSHAGVKGWWTYDTLSCGRSGSANIDLFNGNLVVHHADTSTIGSRMPVSVQHTYNSCQSLSDDFGCGLGWRTSLHQTVRTETVASSDYYIWQDGEGTDHFFEETGTQPYSDCEGMQLKLSVSGNTLTITDKGDSVMTFEKTGDIFRLTTAADAHGNRMLLEYDTDGRLVKAMDGIDRETEFIYNDSGLLSSVTAPDCSSVQYEYAEASGGHVLYRVRYSDLTNDKFTEYAYDGSMLTGMKNIDGCEITLMYENGLNAAIIDGYTEQSRRVTEIEFKNGEAKGAKRKYAYAHMRTDVIHMENETDGKKITYHFNSSGNVVDTNDEMWYTYGTKYDSGIENAPSDSGRVRKAVINRIKNSDFYTGWTQTKGNSADAFSLDSGNLCMSIRGAKMVKGGEGESSFNTTAALFEPGKYTFSAYIKTTGLTVSTSNKGAFIRAIVNGVAYESEAVMDNTAAREINTFANGWQRVYVTFPFAGTPGTTVNVSLVCDASAGTVWFSCPQVEEGETANMFNLVMNADFAETYTSSGTNEEGTAVTRCYPVYWTDIGQDVEDFDNPGVVADRAVNKLPDTVQGNALCLYSRPKYSSIYMGQMIHAYGQSGDTFVLGGWANTESVQGTYYAAKPSIRYRFAADEGDSMNYFTDWEEAYFTPENGSWHHMTTTITAPQVFRKIEIAPGYNYNTLTGMFTHLYLHRDLYGSSFTYDDNGNVVNVKNLTNQQSQAQYDDYDNLLSYVQPGSASTEKYTFTYGTTEAEKKRHLPLTSTTPMGVKSATTYDNYGNALTNTVQPSSDALLMKTETVYTENGNYVASQKDARGNVVTNTIDANGKVTAVTDPAGNTVYYSYDASNRVTNTYLFGTGKKYNRKFTYENDRKKTVSHNTTDNECDVTYTYLYDELGRSIGVKVGNSETPLSANTYEQNWRGLLVRTDFANGGKVRYAYDTFGRITAIGFDDNDPAVNPQYEVLYDARGTASVIRDNVLGTKTHVVSDLADRVCESVTTDASGNLLHKTQISYDSKNRVSAYTDRIPGEMHETAFTYDADNRVTEVKFDDSENTKVVNTYDLLNRLTGKTVTNGEAYTSSFAYLPGNTDDYGANATTSLVQSITQGEGANAMNFAYTYDSRGNITSETRNGVTVEYEYDKIGQLVRVNDPNDAAYSPDGTTWMYIYDCGGNLQMRLACDYTPGTQVVGGLLNGNYTYGDSNWKDKLTAFDGLSISYDAIGNPTAYGAWTYSWKMGRLLDAASNSENNFTLEFKYNKSGLRTQKVKKIDDVITETTDYVMSNKTLISMKKGNDTLYFSYDMSGGSPVMVTYNGARYTYVKNLLGDVVALLDASGSIVCEYKYDAWGKPLSVTGTMAQTIGALNPFRYRGYIWDEDMESYYLRSRYYNPGLCRFLQADALLTMNAFAYANNNPVMKVDADGTEATSAETVDAVIYFHVKYNEFGVLDGAHFSMSVGNVYISFGGTDEEGGRLTILDMNNSSFKKQVQLPSTRATFKDVTFEKAMDAIGSFLKMIPVDPVDKRELAWQPDMGAVGRFLDAYGYTGIDMPVFDKFRYKFKFFPCIAPVRDTFIDDLGIDIDNLIGNMLWGNGKVGKSGSLYLFAKHHIEMGHLEYGQNTVFERNAYGEWKKK